MLNEKIRRLMNHGFEVYYVDGLDCFYVNKGKYFVLLEIDVIYAYHIELLIDMVNNKFINLYLEDVKDG
jgi:hypothetical protein